jgi:hypothetical protein
MHQGVMIYYNIVIELFINYDTPEKKVMYNKLCK